MSVKSPNADMGYPIKDFRDEKRDDRNVKYGYYDDIKCMVKRKIQWRLTRPHGTPFL